jgi:hypothetical protein
MYIRYYEDIRIVKRVISAVFVSSVAFEQPLKGAIGAGAPPALRAGEHGMQNRTMLA